MSHLSTSERVSAAAQAENYTPGHGYEFCCKTTAKGEPISTEAMACAICTEKPGIRRYLSPEVWLAYRRSELHPEGIYRALSDLIGWFQARGHNYLDLLEEAPLQIAWLLRQGHAGEGPDAAGQSR